MIELIPRTKIPERRNCRHDLQAVIKDFVNSKAKICEFKFEVGVDYKSPKTANWCIRTAIKRSGENIKVYFCNNRIYLEKQVED